MDEAGRDALRVGFDRTAKLEFHWATVSSRAGLLPYSDLDAAVQLTESAGAELLDHRNGIGGFESRSRAPSWPTGRGCGTVFEVCLHLGHHWVPTKPFQEPFPWPGSEHTM